MQPAQIDPPPAASPARSPFRAAATRRASAEEMIRAVVEALRELLAADLAEGLPRALRALGEGARVDRVYAIRYDPLLQAGVAAAEYCAPGIPLLKETVGLGPFSYADFEEVWRPLMSGLTYSSPLTQKTGANHDLNLAVGTKSDLFVPVRVGDRFWGTLGFDDCTTEREFSEGEVAALRGAAEGVAAAVARHEAELSRKRSAEEAQERLRAEQQVRAEDFSRYSRELARQNRLLDASARASALLAAREDFDAAVREALGIVAAAADFDAASIVEYVSPQGDPDPRHFRVSHTWRRGKAILPDQGEPFSGTHDEMPNFAAQVLRRDSILDYRRDELPDLATSALQREMDGLYYLVGSIWIDDRPWGAFSCEDYSTDRRRGEDEKGIIAVAARAIGQAVHRRKMEERAERLEWQVLLARESAARERAEGLTQAVEVLRSSTTRLAGVPNLDEFLAGLLRQMMVQLSGREARLFRYDASDLCLRLLLDVSLVEDREAPPARIDGSRETDVILPANSPAWRRLIAHRGAIYFDLERDHRELWPAAADWLRLRGQRGSICVALMAGEEPLGLLSFVCPDKETYHADELNLTNALAQQASLAIAMTRLADQAKQAAVANDRRLAAQQRADELEAVNRALRVALADLVSIEDLNDFLSRLLRESMNTVGAQTGAVALIKEEKRKQVVQFFRRGPVDSERLRVEEMETLELPAELPLFTEQLSRQDHSCSIDPEKVSTPVAFLNFHRREGSRAVRLAPLRAGDRLLGWMSLGFATDAIQSADKMALLRGLADQMALAVELTRLASVAKTAAVNRERDEASQRHVEELVAANETLRRSTANLVALTDLPVYLGSLLMAATQMSGARVGEVFTYDAETRTLIMVAAVIEGRVCALDTDPRFEMWRKPVPEPMLGTWLNNLLKRNMHSFEPDRAPAERRGWFNIQWHLLHGHRLVIDLPLYVGDNLVGVLGLCFTSKNQPSTFALEQVRVLGQQASVAIQLARLAEAGRRYAVRMERNRLARDLHDTLAQGFTGVLTQLGAAEGEIEEGKLDGVSRYLERAKELARFSLAEARSSVHAIRPETSGDPLELRFKRMMAAMTAGTSLVASVATVGVPVPLGPVADWCAHKFVQEALANAVKHSGAVEFRVVLEWDGDVLKVNAIDDGCGFDEHAITPGLGLSSMRERAAEVHGRLEIRSRPGAGCHLCLVIPTTHPL